MLVCACSAGDVFAGCRRFFVLGVLQCFLGSRKRLELDSSRPGNSPVTDRVYLPCRPSLESEIFERTCNSICSPAWGPMDVSLTSDSLDQTLAQQVLYTPLLLLQSVWTWTLTVSSFLPPHPTRHFLSLLETLFPISSHPHPHPHPSHLPPSPLTLGQATFDLLPTSFPSTPPLTLASSPYSTVQPAGRVSCFTVAALRRLMRGIFITRRIDQ
ncbi:hypothetical protein B0J15DRAFT_226591 [Fusarium solani]|uniref:Uncharacterized protein n=1 Tax=Fusarium solani TaxID=169388 RepID=A0A9P9RAI4_FUSSL|nr:uncharacterized protein B0J15DRAFT_226591 [Fusarium solani]KAH7271882.1 hypothetical protein B0J15DRAFT_226591 [Fusarium solani]